MATINMQVGSTTGGGAIGQNHKSNPVLIDQVVNMGAITHTASDDIQVLPITAGTLVLATGIQVLTADTAGNSGTIVARLGTTARGSATAPTSTGYTAALFNATVAQATANTTVNILTATGTTNGVYRVWALVQPLDDRGYLAASGTSGSPTYTAV